MFATFIQQTSEFRYRQYTRIHDIIPIATILILIDDTFHFTDFIAISNDCILDADLTSGLPSVDARSKGHQPNGVQKIFYS